MDVTFLDGLTADLVITLGAVLQASTGLGAGLLVVPLLALINLDLVPGPVIFASLALSGLMTYRGRDDIKRDHLHTVGAGLVAGMLGGMMSLAHLAPSSLGLLFGSLILLAVLLTALGLKVRTTRASSLLTGAVAGFMGMTAAIGAPVLALLYQHEEGKTLRATLAFLYLFSSIGALLLLHLVGRFQWQHALLGLSLVPGILIGYLAAGKVAPLLDQGYVRPIVLLMSATSALTLIWRSMS